MYNLNLPNQFKVVKETHDTNFGHDKVITKGDVYFPPRNEDRNFRPDFFDKQAEINNKNVIAIENQKDYFELYRYGINELKKPNDNDNITFSISLFKPNTNQLKIGTDEAANWITRYFKNHLKQILLINFFFPEANYRTYLDYYMLAFFESLSGDDDRLKLNKYINNFDHIDYENYEIDNINKIFNYFLIINKEFENKNFENGLARILFYYDIACKIIISNGNPYLNKTRTGDFFVYKFKGPFLENIGTELEGHITNGYIGQGIRYISTIQQKYEWNGSIIKRPTYLVWRDAHTNSLAYNDFEWISKLYKICKEKKNKLFFIPSSIDYVSGWHDLSICKVNNTKKFRSAIAGIVQFINFTEDEYFIPFDIYKKSIGMMFLLNKNNELPIKIHRPWGYAGHMNAWKKEYEYGIEEYCFASFFNLDYFMKNSIFYNHHFITRIYSIFSKNDILANVEFLLFKFLVDNNIINKTYKCSRFDFIREIEKLRNNRLYENNKELNLLLLIYPNKYFFNETIFSIDENTYNYTNTDKKSYEERINDFKPIENMKLTLENLSKININCSSIIINNAIEWCVEPYIYSQYNNCIIDENLLGFYYNKQSELDDICILRNPDDLIHVINTLEKNKLKIKLNYSNNKLNYENKTLLYHIWCTLYLKNNMILIQHFFLSIISYYIYINNQTDINNYIKSFKLDPIILSSFFFKALNYANYDIDPKYFNNDYIKKKIDYKIFKYYAKKLSIVNLWAEFTINLLINCNETKDDYTVEDIVNTYNLYKYKNKNYISPNYKMETY